jgi:hypothetical protein
MKPLASSFPVPTPGDAEVVEVSRAIAFIDARAGEPITTREIAAATRTSVRALRARS